MDDSELRGQAGAPVTPVKLERPGRWRGSFSRYDTFLSNCELRAALDAKTPRSPESPAQARGSHVHDLAECLAKMRLSGELCADAIRQAVATTDGPLAIATATSYADRLVPFLNSCDPAEDGIERWFEGIAWQGAWLELPFVGKVDLVSHNTPAIACRTPDEVDLDVPSVWDYKTISNAQRIKQHWQARRSLQLKTYCLATGVSRAGFVYLQKHGDPTYVWVDFSEEELTSTFRMLQYTERTIEHRWEHGGWGLSSPDNALCSSKWCPHWKACMGSSTGPTQEGIDGYIKP